MIITSLSRKNPSFRQLARYMLTANGAKLGLLHNLPADATKASLVVEAFEGNFRYLPARVNGNALYHEIIALPPDSAMPRARQIGALRDLASRYFDRRAPNQLAFGVIHTDTPHMHVHLMISSNAALSDRRIRLGKAEFARIQAELEREQARDFPELGETRHYGARERDRSTSSQREQKLVTRSGKRSDRELVAAVLDATFRSARDPRQLADDLEGAGLQLYQRGKSIGVETRKGRRYRLRTLGLAELYAETASRFELEEEERSASPARPGRERWDELDLER